MGWNLQRIKAALGYSTGTYLYPIIKSIVKHIVSNSQCPNDVIIADFLDNTQSSYPLGIFNVNGDYVGIAVDQSDYISKWNADPANQAVGALTAGSTTTTFGIAASTGITKVRGLRYYEYIGYANMPVFTGPDDIIVYGTTPTVIKKGSVDGVATNTDTRLEWNLLVFSASYKTKIPADTVYVVACPGYIGGLPMQIFHNEDSKYAGVASGLGGSSAQLISISGELPKGLLAIWLHGKVTTDYNSVSNWPELTSLLTLYIFHTGGGVGSFNPIYYPAAVDGSTLKRMILGQWGNAGSISVDYAFVTAAEFPILEELIMAYNTHLLEPGSETWFLTMPKVTNFLFYVNQTVTLADAVTADGIWNNIATALNGIVPVGAYKQLRIMRTNNVTAASLASRNYLVAQGWTVTTA